MSKKKKPFEGLFEWLDDGKQIHQFPQPVAVPDWETGEARYGMLYFKTDLQMEYEKEQCRAEYGNSAIVTPDGEKITFDEMTVHRIAFKEDGKSEIDPIAPLFAKTIVNGTEVFIIDVMYFEGIGVFKDGTERPVCLVPFSEDEPLKYAMRDHTDLTQYDVYQSSRQPDIIEIRPRGERRTE